MRPSLTGSLADYPQGLYDAADRPPPTRPIRPRPVRRSLTSLADALAQMSLRDEDPEDVGGSMELE